MLTAVRPPTGGTAAPRWGAPLRSALAVLLVAALGTAGCGGASTPDTVPSDLPGFTVRTAGPAPDPSQPFDLASALELIERRTYTPYVPKGPLRGPLRAIQGMCTGSANGRCQEVFFFYGQRLVGSVHAGVMSIVSQDGTTVVIELPQYRPGDPGCCPSGKPSRHAVRFDGSMLRADPPVPENPNNY